MQSVKATEMKHRLGDVLNRARLEPVTVTTHGRPSHVLLSYQCYLSLVQPLQAAPFHEIADAEARSCAVDDWLDEVAAHAVSADPGVVTREDYYE